MKREVAKAKQKAYDELYERLDTKEGEKELCRQASQRDGAGKDLQQVWDVNVLNREESVLRRWKEYFEEIMNEGNESKRRMEEVGTVKREVGKFSEDVVIKVLKRMKNVST